MDEFNVVVVVDEQNCFMFATSDQNSNLLNLGFKGTADESKQIAQEISNLVNMKTIGINNAVVFTRDYHPLNHISFEYDEGRKIDHANTWPRHCRNPNVKCAKREGSGKDEEEGASTPSTKKLTLDDVSKSNKVDLEVVNKKLGIEASKIPIQGTELSYYFYETELAKVVSKLNNGNKKGSYKIGLRETSNETKPQISSDKIKDWHDIVIPNVSLTSDESGWSNKTTKFITLTKGERCDEESYSAFNYHVKYNIDGTAEYKLPDTDEKVPSSPIYPVAGSNPLIKENSTGLWEWILNNKKNATKINVTVCGLVGNVCVIFTVLQGIAMWEAVYKTENPDITVNFEYSLMGTRFTTGLVPAKEPIGTLPQVTVKPYDDYSIDTWNEGKPFSWWINEMKGYYAGNILSDANLESIKEQSFKVLKYDGSDLETVKMSNILDNVNTTAPAGGRRSIRNRHRKRHTHKIDRSGYCKLCYKYCKNNKLTKRNKQSRKCRK
jgi:nicotinamidase-related amidase